MLKILWTDRIKIKNVHKTKKKEMEVMYTIKHRKLKYMGHITEINADTPS